MTQALKTTTETANPIFYANPTALDREQHRRLKIRPDAGYGFSAGAQFVPALHEEFTSACHEFPIVFLADGSAPAPVFLLGLENGENRMVDAAGTWTSRYVPAYLRRYPFILGEMKDTDPIICIDEASGVFSDEEGDALFDDEGKETGRLRDIIAFTNEYFLASKRTQEAMELLAELRLFRTISVDLRDADGSKRSIQGLLSIDEEKMRNLADADYLKLRDRKLIGPIYAHLFSLSQFGRLTDTK